MWVVCRVVVSIRWFQSQGASSSFAVNSCQASEQHHDVGEREANARIAASPYTIIRHAYRAAGMPMPVPMPPMLAPMPGKPP